MPNLTVRETLQYAADLKLPRGMKKEGIGYRYLSR